MATPRVSFKTVGCRLNQAETARIAAQFESAHYDVVPFGTPCDIAVIHSCTVTRHAEKRSIRLARAAKQLADKPFVILAGCAAQIGGEDILRASGADMIAGQQDKFRLPQLLEESTTKVQSHSVNPPRRRRSRQAATCPEGATWQSPTPPPPAASGNPQSEVTPRFDTTRAFVKVQDGCDFNCAYCVVPAARGASTSRPMTEVVDEITKLGDTGFREIVLTGANLGCYRDGTRHLVHLLDAVEAIPAIKRVRLSSIELSTNERAIIDFMAASEKVCRFLHLPLQSGDDRILAAMGRRYTASEYSRVVEYTVEKLGLIGLGTDLIVGLPGEDEKAFEATFQLAQKLPYSNLHVFPYSKRPLTRATAMSCQVPKQARKSRITRLIELGRAKKEAFARECAGREVSVLIEQVDEYGNATGWTGEYLEASIRTPSLRINQITAFRPSRAEGPILVFEPGGKKELA